MWRWARCGKFDMNGTMRYIPADVSVRQGETIRFIVKNSGQVKHQMSLGAEKELLEHLKVIG